MATNVTTRMQAPVLLVGSMPFTTVEEALRASGELLGGDLACIPDGEVGPRALWVGFLPIGVYLSHPGLEVMHARSGPLQQPKNSDDSSAVRIDPEGRQTFRVRPGSDLKLDLKYGEFAQESYEVFKRLRSDGVIPDAVRFQACIPAPSSGADPFFEDVDQWPAVHKAYIDGINHAVETMLETIPADDLVVQLDFCWEVIDIEFGERSYFPHWPVATVEEKFERHTDLLARAARDIPEEVWLGYHLCYGTWGGWPMTAMRDLDLCVRLANAVVPKTGRRVHYVHMPATEGAGDAFFAPLDRLEIGDTRIYLGSSTRTSSGSRGSAAASSRHSGISPTSASRPYAATAASIPPSCPRCCARSAAARRRRGPLWAEADVRQAKVRAGVYRGIRNVAVEVVAEPELGARDAIVAVKACGICGSDLHVYLEGGPPVEVGQVMGHEFAGEVVAVGAEVEGVVAGDRVAGFPVLPCGECRRCRKGVRSLCDNWIGRSIGFGLPGAFAERVRIPAAVLGENVFLLPDTLSFAAGALAEPLAVGVRAVDQAQLAPDQTAVVFGLGTIGIQLAQVLLARGVSTVVGVNRSPLRRAIAEQLGVTVIEGGENLSARVRAALGGREADVVFEVSGEPVLVQTALDTVCAGGTVVMVALWLSGHELRVQRPPGGGRPERGPVLAVDGGIAARLRARGHRATARAAPGRLHRRWPQGGGPDPGHRLGR